MKLITYLLSSLLIITASATEKTSADLPATDFIRVLREADRVKLQTSITRYEKKGQIVDLVGAIHTADAEYFDKLNQEFTSYDAVLFEIIGGEILKIRPDILKNAKPFSIVILKSDKKTYNIMSNDLGMADQRKSINYIAKNFIHADITQAENSMLKKIHSQDFFMPPSTLAISKSKKDHNALTAELIAALKRKDENKLKLMLFDEASVNDEIWRDLVGQEDNVGYYRNTKCFDILSREIKKGKKKVAIFYGASHFPDMENRLLKMGYTQTSHRWLSAWNMKDDSKSLSPKN